METFPLRRNRKLAAGFSLIESMIAILVLCVGLVALGSLAAQSLTGTSRSRFSAVAADLATEKLEDLSRWPTFDPNISAASGTTVGSLTSDSSATVTAGGIPAELVNYYDDVDISDSNGAISETVSAVVAGSTVFKTTSHNPDGTISTSTSASSSAAGSNAAVFHRRWTIEMDQPVTGLRRITVLVTLQNSVIHPPIGFQMTMVRP